MFHVAFGSARRPPDALQMSPGVPEFRKSSTLDAEPFEVKADWARDGAKVRWVSSSEFGLRLVWKDRNFDERAQKSESIRSDTDPTYIGHGY